MNIESLVILAWNNFWLVLLTFTLAYVLHWFLSRPKNLPPGMVIIQNHCSELHSEENLIIGTLEKMSINPKSTKMAQNDRCTMAVHVTY